MRRLSTAFFSLIAIGILTAPALANFVNLGKVSASSLASSCSKAGGSFNQNSAGYSCETKNCNGKGGTCGVYCDAKQNCDGYAPDAPAKAVKQGSTFSTGAAGVMQILSNKGGGGSARDAASGRRPSVLTTGGGVLDGSSGPGSQGPAATGAPAGGRAPPPPANIIR